MKLTAEIESKNVLRVLGATADAGSDFTQPLGEFAQYMRVQTDNTFEALRRGGRFRGVFWADFRPQYTRKTDDVTVPAWGGVPKVRGEGLVKGRLRPSGQRLKAGDAILQDAMTLRGRAALVVRLDRTEVRIGPQGVKYAAAQHKKRPFLFFAMDDRDMALSLVADHIRDRGLRGGA